MRDQDLVEERVVIDADGLRLEGVLAYPETGAPGTAFVVLAPHPHMGGTMDNNVVRHLARRGAAAGALSLRFNYRGVGGSEIRLRPGESVFDHFSEMEAQQRYEELLPDAAGAFRALGRWVPDARRIIIGYSLGAVLAGMLAAEASPACVIGISPPVRRVALTAFRACAAPKCFVFGDDDFAFALETFLDEYAALPPPKTYRKLEGCDHFFRREEERLFQAIFDCLFPECAESRPS